MKAIKWILFAGAGLLVSLNVLHAQSMPLSEQAVQSIGGVPTAPPDSVVRVAADSQGLAQIDPVDLPFDGTYYWAMPDGGIWPMPFLPQDAGPIYQITDNQFLVDNSGGELAVPLRPRRFGMQAQSSSSIATVLAGRADGLVSFINQIQEQELNREINRLFGFDDETDDSPGGFGMMPLYDPNGLWIQITNASNGWAYFNLHNATNQVYAIKTTTDILTPCADWQVEMELWPTLGQTNVLPFVLPTLDRPILFARAEDWTGVDSGGNGLLDWWEWKYFGNYNENATNLDSTGSRTLFYDYQHGLDPNVIQFGLNLPIDLATSNPVNGTINLFSGTPSYMAILVNDTNQADAVWQTYNSNVVVSLNMGNGAYNVLVGLRGLPADAQKTWQSGRVSLYSVPPVLMITAPTSNVVSVPIIQVRGFANKELASLTYGISNAAGIFTNQSVYLAGQFYDTNLMAFTGSYFQCYDVALTNGLNTIILYGTDLAGNLTTTHFNVSLDYSLDKTPPVFNVLWPQDGTTVSGSKFTLLGQLDDTTANVRASIVDTSGNTNIVSGLIERSGKVWLQNLPLSAGTNNLTLTATDAAGNASAISLKIIGNDVGLTVNPLASDQLNHAFVTVRGTVGDASYVVAVNNIQAIVLDDLTWEADNVPVSPTGTAAFNIEVRDSNGSLIASQTSILPQPVIVELKSYFNQGNDAFDDPPRCGFPLDISGNAHYLVNWTREGGGHLDLYDYRTPNGDSGGEYSESYDLVAGDGQINPPWENAGGQVSGTEHLNCEDWSFSATMKIATHVMIEPPGLQESTINKLYLVQAVASTATDLEWRMGVHIYGEDHLYFGTIPMPPEWLQINGQTLINSGITNADGATWGGTIVSAPAGANVDVTPNLSQDHQCQDYTFDVEALDVTHILAVDNNRDGQITFDDTDATTPSQPYRFWVNDSKESGDVSTSFDSTPGSSTPNYAQAQVQGRSDLVNFFPVALCLSNALSMFVPTIGYEYHLSQADSAVKLVYTSLMPTNTADYLTNLDSYGYGTNADEWVTNADTIQVTSSKAAGTVLDINWLAMVQNNGGYGVILMEGCATSTAPLMLEIWHNGNLLGGVPMCLSIGGVEQMYRWVNLRHEVGAPENRYTDLNSPPNFPDSFSNGKNFIFVHGYNLTETKARGWSAEIFKRLWQSGSKAKFYAVDWNGSESYISTLLGFRVDTTPNYHTNVANAFITAPYFQGFLASLNGETTLAGHSLGNMLCLSAISDWGAQPKNYFMIDAAVPMEAIDGSLDTRPSMVHPDWTNVANCFWASKWFNVWTNTDGRNTLTWNNRLANFGTVNVYNFFSSGEEVLREDPGAPPSGALSAIFDNAVNYWSEQTGFFVWSWQEKLKGRTSIDVVGSTHGGWKFNDDTDSGYVKFINQLRTHVPPAVLTNSVIQTNAFFDMSVDKGLFTINSSGSDYAQFNRNGILSDSIPALTLPIGANSVSRLSQPKNLTENNFDMQSLYQNSWPAARLTTDEGNNWHHSDIRDIAYPFNYKFFIQLVNLGNLK